MIDDSFNLPFCVFCCYTETISQSETNSHSGKRMLSQNESYGQEMKRNIFLTAITLLFILTMIFCVVYLNNPAIFDAPKSNTPVIKREIVAVSNVFSGEIMHTFNTEGKIISGRPDIYVETQSINISYGDEIQFYVEKGEDIDEGQLLVSVNGDKFYSDFPSKVLSIDTTESGNSTILNITLLNYEKLVVMAEVDADIYSMINYSTPVTVMINGQKFDSVFLDIGYEIYDGKIQVAIKAPCLCLPGTSASISFVTEIIEKGCFIPIAFLEKSNGSYYVLKKSGDTCERIKVEVGESFFDETYEYVEIISGLSSSDTVVIENVFSESNNGGLSSAD